MRVITQISCIIKCNLKEKKVQYNIVEASSSGWWFIIRKHGRCGRVRCNGTRESRGVMSLDGENVQEEEEANVYKDIYKQVPMNR